MAFQLLGSINVAANSTLAEFNAIPQTHRELVVIYTARGNVANQTSNIGLRFNNSSVDYATAGVQFGGSGSFYFAGTGVIGDLRALVPENYPQGIARITIPDYTKANASAATNAFFTCYNPDQTILFGRTTWRNTSAITNVRIVATANGFGANSKFYLYGVS